MRQLNLTIVIGLSVSLLLCGCGFHLRGQVALPPELSRTYVTGVAEYTDFGAELRQQLRAHGIDVVDDAKASTATLRITQNTNGKRVLAVDERGKVREFELFAQVAFEVKGQDKKVLLKNQTITVTRDFIFDENDVLGKSVEEQIILQDMHEDLVRLMLFRLRAIS